MYAVRSLASICEYASTCIYVCVYYEVLYTNAGMEDVAVVFGQPQLLVVDLPYGDSEAEFAQQGMLHPES